jgi:hypothetical protein
MMERGNVPQRRVARGGKRSSTFYPTNEAALARVAQSLMVSDIDEVAFSCFMLKP